MNIVDKFHNWRRKQRWNRQYKKGRWNNLRSDRESVRYERIVGFTKKHSNANPDIMALGCGEGILFEHTQNIEYSSFLGMDFSKVSINKAKQLAQNKSEFVCADIHSFKPKTKYDVIVFNEIFYYIHETKKNEVLATMLSHLKENGILIISIYREGLGCWEYFNENSNLKLLDFETVETDEEKTYWKIGAYRKV